MAGCTHIPYLERRPSGFFFRRRIPIRIRFRESPFGKTFLSFSLRTHVPSDAKAVARSLTALSDLAFDLMSERMMQQHGAETLALLTELARFQIDVHEAARAVAPPRPEEAGNYVIACERATQDALRRALALGDREPVRQILRDTAARLGVALDESSADWRGLAHEALKVMLDVSRERERREMGQYDGPTIFFHRAMQCGTDRSVPVSLPGIPGSHVPSAAIPPASPVQTQGAPTVIAAVAADAAETCAERPAAARAPMAIHQDPGTPVAPGNLRADQADAPAQRETRVLIDTTLLTKASRAAIGKGPGIELREAFALYIELKELGYGENFEARQKRFPDKGKNWKKSSGGNAVKAGEIWVDILGNQPFDQIDWTEAEEALGIIARIPTYHGKKADLMNTKGFRALVDHADDLEAERASDAVDALKRRRTAPSPAEIEKAQIDALIPRIRVNTYLRHGRMANRVGKMLKAMRLIDDNPFEICSWTNDEEKEMCAMEEDRTRTLWDDRIYKLFRSPVFRGEADDAGDPLFWAPLLARFGGGREEEILQLSPDDFGQEDGLDYYRIRNTAGNSVKSTAGERRIPVHPKLLALGLMDLVNLRRQQNQPRLFPDLARGQTKGTFSELFSKRFGYYRRTNHCYWPGLDFHALRTTFHNDVVNLLCPDLLRRRLMGHEGSVDEGDRSYTRHVKIKALHEMISRIDVDTSMIVSPFGEAPSTARERGEKLNLRVIG